MKINHITILVKDRLKAAEFYSDILDLKIIEKGEHRWIKIDEQYIHLAQNSGLPTENSFAHFCIAVADLPTLIKKLIAKNIQVFDFDDNLSKTDINTNLDREIRLFFINDIDGNLIELIDTNNDFFK
jgi:catechol 2,3-dioxygenase-like lactoylglutathione lyase family enzyme